MRKTRGITILIILSPRRGVYNSQALRVSPTQQGLFHGKWLTQRNANESQNPAFYRDCDEQKAYLGKECLGADSFNVEANNRVVLGESYGIFVDQILGYQVLSRIINTPFSSGRQ